MKLKIKRTVSVVLFLCIFILGLIGLYRILSWKDTSGEYFSSFEQLESLPDDTVDVMALGPSLAYGSFNPAYFWKESGTASFTMAISGMTQTSAYYTLKEALKTQSPKVIFIESVLFHTDEYLDEGNIYRNTVLMKPSKNNTELILETADKGDAGKYLFRFPIVHSRYSELKKNDFVKSTADKCCLGFTNEYKIEPQDPDYDILVSDEVTEISDSTKEWIDRIVSLSKEHGFEIVFYSSPQNILLYYQKITNGCYEYLDELGIKYIDLNKEYLNTGIDYATDFSDHSHINRFGADKTCEYLSQYMNANFDLEDHRGDNKYSRWDICSKYDDYVGIDFAIQSAESKEEMISKASSYENILVVSRMGEVISVCFNDTKYAGDENGLTLLIPGFDEYLFANKDIAYVGDDCIIASGLEGDIVYIYDAVTGNVVCYKTFE